MMYDPVNTAYS